ncbi:hypothetical protein OGATHE_002249 [Ogataea polymorpha]|uniref:Zn(2)-C6 fungal-type domain-containing protein n=1 Tax=Ogataea polymorpha TaxID=460523 RepID=A0A9P8TBF7_9ASCO|nr:hypothetical protein OGATHE_002249 [Ogataea polymorpha]
MKGIKKSKSGCLVCKRRKKKCDEAKPRCGHCQRLGLECKYGVVLNWVKLQLRAQVHASGAQPTSYHLVNANFTNVGLSYYLLQMSPNCPVRIHNELWTATVAEPCIDPRKTSPEYLFNHYVRNMSKSRSFCGSTDTANEFVSIIVPLCQNFTALNQSVLCYAAIDLLKEELTSPTPHKDVLQSYYSLYVQFKDDAINGLHLILDTCDLSNLEILEELIITIMILCAAEIANNTSKNWVNLMKEGFLVFSSLQMTQILNSKVLTFVYRYFSLRYVLLVCTLKGDILAQLLDSCRWPVIESFFESDTVDHLFGCSPRLLHTIHRMVVLNHARETNAIEESVLVEQYLGIWTTLSEMKQRTAQDIAELDMCAAAYLVAAKVYFCMLLLIGNLSFNRNFKRKFILLTKHLKELLVELSKVNMKVFFPGWALLVLAACQSCTPEGEEVRQQVMDIIQTLELKWPLSTVAELKDAVQAIWVLYDTNIEEPENLSGALRLEPNGVDWRDVICAANYRLPLV